MAGKLEKQLKKKHAFATPQQAVVIGLLRTSDLVQYRRTQFLREYQLTQAQYNVLRILRGQAAPLPCLEIADRMITMVPAITSLIDRLEQRKLVKKVRSRKDRRVWLVSITAAGKTLLAKIDRPLLDHEANLCRGLSKTECKQLADLLERARSGLEQNEPA